MKKKFFKEAFKICKNGGAIYNSYGVSQSIECYNLCIWNTNKNAWDFFNNENAPEDDYWIVLNLKKSCGMIKTGNDTPVFIEKVILLWKLPYSYMRGVFLEKNTDNPDKMKLLEWTMVCSETADTDLFKKKLVALCCIGIFGNDEELTKKATELLEVRTEDEE